MMVFFYIQQAHQPHQLMTSMITTAQHILQLWAAQYRLRVCPGSTLSSLLCAKSVKVYVVNVSTVLAHVARGQARGRGPNTHMDNVD
jgi:hypothetical protein